MLIRAKDVRERKKCIMCGSENLEKLHEFKEFPVNQNTTDASIHSDITLNLEYDICPRCGMIQVRKIASEEVLYNKEHSRSIGTTWQNHHKTFAKFISEYYPQCVFEIGGGAGYLEKYYNNERDQAIKWTILEPNPDPVEGCQADYEIGFFDENYKIRTPFDTIVFSHLLEHIYNPAAFIHNLAKIMTSEQRLIFSVPNMQAMLQNMQTNTLNFEHTFYLGEPYVDYLLSLNGYEVIKKEYYQEHSIFYSCIKKEGTEISKMANNLYSVNKAMFDRFVNNYERFVESVMKKIELHQSGKIYLFGAHLFSQFLIAFGIDENEIEAILDNDVQKQGKRLQGCGLFCESPQVLAKEDKPIVILRTGTYQEEIKKDILENINQDTIFWE